MKNGGPAFPVPNYVNADGETWESKPQGMTLRDYFAAKAMQGMCACSNTYDYTDTEGKTVADYVADHAYFMADAMLAERAKHE